LASAAPAPKVDVCHYDADAGTFHKINISENAFQKHLDHGDAAPGEAVPTMPGYVFTDSCEPELAVVTGSAALLQSGWDCVDSDLAVKGTVDWSSDGSTLSVTYSLDGGAANTAYHLGFSYDAGGGVHPMFVQPLSYFPSGYWPYNGNCSGTLSQYLTRFATVTTDANGDLTETVVLEVNPGTYQVQFYLTIGWVPRFQTGGYIGDYETVVIPG
jgi:hypothetical protein